MYHRHTTGFYFWINMSSYQYKSSHCKGTMVTGLSYLYNDNSSTWKSGLYIEPGGHFKNTYELLNLRALKFSLVEKIYIFQCMGEIFCVEFQRYPLKFHTKYLTHKLKNLIFIQHWNFKSSYAFVKCSPKPQFSVQLTSIWGCSRLWV